MEHKNIDNLFKKQLKNLEVSPNNKVWNSIETKLSKKKKRVFPFWIFSGSIAAILVLGLFLYPKFKVENQNNKVKIKEIITNTTKENSTILNTIDSLILKNNKSEEIIITQKKPTLDTQKNSINSRKKIKQEVKNTSKKEVNRLILNYNNIESYLVSTVNKPIINNLKLVGNSTTKKLNFLDFTDTKEAVETLKETNSKNWSVTPLFAILKSNSFTKASPINPDLANSTKGENSYSYGVQIGYKLNKKWTIQSGLHLQETNFSNNQIAVVSSLQSNISSVSFANGNSFSFALNSIENLSIDSSSLTNIISTNSNLNQTYGYIEIPVEIKYNFSNNKKIETQLVTGFSSLFLNKNEVNLASKTSTISGEVTNLNKLNFSGNLGLDFNYFINKKLSFNINPMFKIQLNTFNKNANGFSPYNLGIYSGFKFQF